MYFCSVVREVIEAKQGTSGLGKESDIRCVHDSAAGKSSTFNQNRRTSTLDPGRKTIPFVSMPRVVNGCSQARSRCEMMADQREL